MKRLFLLLGLVAASVAFAAPDVSAAAFGLVKWGEVDLDGDHKIDAQFITGGNAPSNVAFANTWNGIDTTAPSKNAVYDQLHKLDTDDDGKVNTVEVGAPGQVPYMGATSLTPGTQHESATSRWMVNTAGWVTDEWPKTGNTIYVCYSASGVTLFTRQASGVSFQVAQVAEIGFEDGSRQTTAASITAAGNNTFTGLDTLSGGVSIVGKPLVVQGVKPDFESGISAQVTNTQRIQASAGGVSVATVDNAGFHGAIGAGSSFNVPNNAIPQAAVRTYDAFLEQSKTRSGVSLIHVGAGNGTTHKSGNSLAPNAHNCLMIYERNNVGEGNYDLIGLPPLTAVSGFFLVGQINGSGGGIIFEGTETSKTFVCNIGGTIEHNDGVNAAGRGVSAFVVPANSKYLKFTITGINDTTPYYRVDCDSGGSVWEDD